VSLTNVIIGNNVTNIGEHAFDQCYALASATIPDSVTSFGTNAFANCTGLTSVTMGNSVTSIGYKSFYGCSSLTNVTMGNNVTNIDYEAFYGCSSLTSMTIPNKVTSIGYSAFWLCSKLTNMTVPNTVKNFGIAAFAYCSNLTSVTIGSSVTNLGMSVFAYCVNLNQVYFQGNAPRVNGGAGSADITVFNKAGSGTVYYLPGTTGWDSTFGGWPTAGWYQPQPQILGSGYGMSMQSNGFQFTISWATNSSVVVESSTNLHDWTPLITNALVNGTNGFYDSACTNYPQRFYRVSSP